MRKNGLYIIFQRKQEHAILGKQIKEFICNTREKSTSVTHKITAIARCIMFDMDLDLDMRRK